MSAPEYRVVVGMEVHLQLGTASKMFCECPVTFGEEPNTMCCPVCLGQPGALPVLNGAAFDAAIRLGLAFGCRIASRTKFDRKNYFYPDLPKGYQITQFDRPICEEGALEIDGDDGPRMVRIRRIHCEEDTGKSEHADDGSSLVDFNRSGVPLLELVTEPDLRSAHEAAQYLEGIKEIVQYLGISDCSMEKGQLRCEPNVNVQILEGDEWIPTPIAELKNLNSFSNVEKSIAYETTRQLEEFARTGKRHGTGTKSTRGWDAERGVTVLQREKEEAHDYRYFPEPDLPLMDVAEEHVEVLRATLPELPRARRARLEAEFELPAYDADVLCQSRALADYFEEMVEAGAPARAASKWLQGPVLRDLNERDLEIAAYELAPGALAELVTIEASGDLTRESAHKLLPDLISTGKGAAELVDERGLRTVRDDGVLREACLAAIAANEKSAADFAGGKDGAIGPLIGAVKRATGGQADAGAVRAILVELLRAD